MEVAIYSRGLDIEQRSPLLYLLETLSKNHINVSLYAPLINQYSLKDILPNHIKTFVSNEELDTQLDCLISLGGDGTVLDAVALMRDKTIPLLAINFGRLGFLANINKDELDIAVEALINRTYIIDKRALIHLDASIPVFDDAPFAMNEFAIHKRDTSPMIKIHTYLNGEFLNTYWADGLIVATPTGSTGYNLSCNGPIIFPDASNFVLTPVAPHNLNARPIVLPDSTVLSFEVEGRCEEYICALDARREIVPKNIQLAIKKESFYVNLVRINESSFLNTLHNKLTWGMDKRN